MFYYALSPGLDILFSSTKDIQLLKRKMDQVFNCIIDNGLLTVMYMFLKIGDLFNGTCMQVQYPIPGATVLLKVSYHPLV